MSGIGMRPGSREAKAEPSIGAAREATQPAPTDGGGHWEGGAFIADPVTNYAALTVGQLIEAMTPPPSQEVTLRAQLEHRIMLTHSREAVLKERIRLLEQAINNPQQ